MTHRVAVVVLAWGKEPTLERCVESIRDSRGIDLELVVVDNGADPVVIDRIIDLGVDVLGPPINRGFTGGCNFGVAQTTAPVVALVNSDAFVEPDALAELAEVAVREDVGIASASLRLAQSPETLNSAGNPIHFSGLTWSGSFGEPAANHPNEAEIPSATGAALAMRREVWDLLGGFDDAMFAYLEDTDLSIRCWQAGLAVRFVPSAIVLHDYEFGRNELKFYLLERNRLILILTLYERRTLLLLAPGLLLVELAMTAQSIVGRWFGAKVRGWWWMVTHMGHVKARRRTAASTRQVHDGEWMNRVVGRIEPDNVARPPGMALLNALLDGWWKLARRRLP
ncbi:MAG: glycosyltransferase [Thermoleophilia bacterium]|nr:glycosyltransferase [Thermoleophilia bacterium]